MFILGLSDDKNIAEIDSSSLQFTAQNHKRLTPSPVMNFVTDPLAVFELYETGFALRGIAVDAKFF